MQRIIFTEEFCQPENLYPFTLTRQIQDIRVGILTIREKWERWLRITSFDKQEDDYKDLSRSIPLDKIGPKDSWLLLHGNILPDVNLIKAIKSLKQGECLSTTNGLAIAYHITKKQLKGPHKIAVDKTVNYAGPIHQVEFPWDIVRLNDWAIREDFKLLVKSRKSMAIPKTCAVTGAKNIFIEKGAHISHAILNATEGPIYVGKNAVIMEGAMIRGPFALGENACVKMGTRIYGATSAGPGCVLGGEIKNSVLFGYSNKAHDGYLGDSVIGEWCNLGAGTTNSNIKNTAGVVRVWTPAGEKEVGVKCGVMMGDYSKTAINTSINTGTVIGVAANVFGQGLTPKFIPNFSWGAEGLTRYDWTKAMDDIHCWKQLKGEELNDEEKLMLEVIYKKY